MSKKVLVISTSLRNGSNSQILASEFAKGAKEAGNLVEEITLCGKKIEFCKGCLSCQKTGICVIHDDVKQIVEQMLNSEVVAFATPIYFYEMAGQMKTLLDRLNPIFTKAYRFRDIYLLATAAEGEETAIDGAVSGLKRFIDCFEYSQLKDVLRGVGLESPRDVNGDDKINIRTAAYEMGKNI